MTGSLHYTTAKTATALGVSRATVRRWADEGHLKCYRTPGNQRRFKQSDIEEFIAAMRQRKDDDANPQD